MDEKISENSIEELPQLDPDYDTFRREDDAKNEETVQKLKDEEDAGMAQPGRNIAPTLNVPIKLSDFKDIKYTMRHVHMGYFLIFNQEKFNRRHPYHSKPRAGSSVDATKLQTTMEKLGFSVYRYDNRTTQEVKKYLKQYTSATSNTNVNAFGCAFFSHGEEGGAMATYDGFINAKDVVESVHGQQAQHLIGKPKLFFFQACRGGEYMDGNRLKPVAMSVPPEEKKISWPDAADILCHYATTEGYLSFRNPTHGSWFIRNLTAVVDRYAHELEFHHVLLRVNRGIAEIESQTGQADTSGKKQAAQIQSQLTKELWFKDYKKKQ